MYVISYCILYGVVIGTYPYYCHLCVRPSPHRTVVDALASAPLRLDERRTARAMDICTKYLFKIPILSYTGPILVSAVY